MKVVKRLLPKPKKNMYHHITLYDTRVLFCSRIYQYCTEYLFHTWLFRYILSPTAELIGKCATGWPEAIMFCQGVSRGCLAYGFKEKAFVVINDMYIMYTYLYIYKYIIVYCVYHTNRVH